MTQANPYTRGKQIIIALLVSLFTWHNLSAGIVTVTWPCTSSSRVNTSIKNSPGTGTSNSSNVTVNNQSSSAIFVRDYTGPIVTNEAIAMFWPSTDGGTTYAAWANETSEVATRYIEFSVGVKANQKIKFTSLSMSIGGIATGYLRANVYYSTNNFATKTLINTNGLPVLPQINSASDLLLCATGMDATVNAGETLSIRIYPWFMRSSSSAKSIVLGNVVLSGNDFADLVTVPQLTTTDISGITSSTAVGGGAITSNGGAAVIQSGLCWDTLPNPTVNGQFGTMNGPCEQSFSDNLKFLQGGKTYYVRAYATNSAGTGYGPQKTFQTSSLIAFPGAEGFGKYSIGGRGGTVIEVTNLNDSGSGSLRYALENVTSPRIVVFRLSGTIELQSPLTIKSPYVTIAGQTAPGDGICIKNYPLYVQTEQVIIRYIRCRLGDAIVGDNDAISLMGSKNLILDHCSFSWSIDCVADFTDNSGLCTMQWCIIAEALASENHSKGAHSMGGSWDGLFGGTYHHNLISNTNSRVPRIDAAAGPDMFGKETRDLVDSYNNVIYNWGTGLSYGGENADLNYRNNYIKYGPSTSPAGRYTIFGPTNYCKLHISGNYVYGSSTNSANNLLGISTNDMAWTSTTELLQTSPFKVVEGNIEPATTAYENVLKYAGANFPQRDAVDTRIINEVKSNSGKIIASQSEVGGWPVLTTTTAPVDSDHDGMPDSWENANGLNPADASDRNTKNNTGYTMLELYLNSLIQNSFPTDLTSPAITSSGNLDANVTSCDKLITLRYRLLNDSKVKITLYDYSGRKISVINEGYQTSGAYTKQLNCLTGIQISTGILRIEAITNDNNYTIKNLKFTL